MSMTFEELVRNVQAGLVEPSDFDPTYIAKVGPGLLEHILRIAVKNLGLCVNSNTGEVYDPAPKQVINYPNNQVQNGVHYRGQRRRGYRR